MASYRCPDRALRTTSSRKLVRWECSSRRDSSAEFHNRNGSTANGKSSLRCGTANGTSSWLNPRRNPSIRRGLATALASSRASASASRLSAAGASIIVNPTGPPQDRKSVVSGRGGSDREDLGGGRI